MGCKCHKQKVNESIKLPADKTIVLQADTDEHKRGLVVTWKSDGGYDVAYWYDTPDNIVAAELKGDGKSFGDIKNVWLGYHPKLDERLKKGESGCCHKCGWSHVKGSAHKTPYRSGKNSCANRKSEAILKESYNQSDVKYAMQMAFDSIPGNWHKALKQVKYYKRGNIIKLNMSSYMGPGKVLKKIVDEFNRSMGTKYKIDKNSFVKGSITGIELREAKLNKEKFTKPEDMRMDEQRPMFQDTPNEMAYLDFKKWAYKNRKAVKGILLKALQDNRGDGTYLFLALRQVWLAWANKKAKEWSSIPNKGPAGSKFGRALAVMMKKDNLIISKSTNKLTDLK